jgi:hypothetical protein
VSAPATSLTGVTAEASRFWEQALARFLSLKIADDLTPDDAPDVDRGVDDYCRAMDWLIESVPSPDIHALAYKVRLSVERAAPFAEPLYADHARGILADIQRLSVMALAAAPQADPHPLWLEDRNRLHQLANRHAPMPQAFMDDLIAAMAAIERRIEETPATTVAGWAAKAALLLQLPSEGFDPSADQANGLLAEAADRFGFSHGGDNMGIAA